MSTVKIGKKQLGAGQPCYIIAEIGINHNGDIDLAKRLISVAVAAGCAAHSDSPCSWSYLPS